MSILKGTTFYIATSIDNKDLARLVSSELEALGGSVPAKWFDLPDLRALEGTDLRRAMRERAQFDADGAFHAQRLIAIMPGGRGTHFELGVAACTATMARTAPPILWVPVGVDPNSPYPCVFHEHTEGPACIRRVGGTLDDLLVAVCECPNQSYTNCEVT